MIDNIFSEDNVFNGKWWTDLMYENCYEIVSNNNNNNNKYPLFIPSYNRPDPVTVKTLFSKMNDDSNYPVYVIVRESQREEYSKNIGNVPYVNIMSFPDNEINNLGAVRRKVVDITYYGGHKGCFMFDDDIVGFGYTSKDYTAHGDPKAKESLNKDIPRILAMWQVAMAEAIDKYNVMSSGIMPVFASWKPEYTDCTKSLLIHRGIPSQCMCINVVGFKDNDITYGETKDVAHEDIDMAIRITDKKLTSSDLVKSGLPLKIVQKYKKIFANDEGNDFYIEITKHPELTGHDEHMEVLAKFAKENGVSIVAAHDIYYINPGKKLNF
jgi:hypothetical protein